MLGYRLCPQDGYPFLIDFEIDYAVSAAGLKATLTATNMGVDAAPYGFAAHPYLRVGDHDLDVCSLQLDAGTVLLVDEQLKPREALGVDGTGYDFRKGALLVGHDIDNAFTDIDVDPDGLSWATLWGPGGAEATSMWWDAVERAVVPGLHRRRLRGGVAASRTGHGADDLPAQRLPDRPGRDPDRGWRRVGRALGHPARAAAGADLLRLSLVRGFGRYEFQLMLLRRMADFHPELVDRALAELGANRSEQRAAHRRWQELMRSKQYPSDIRRFEIALGGADDVRTVPFGDVVCHAHRWQLPRLWPDLVWEVVTDGAGTPINEWLVRAGDGQVPLDVMAIQPWSCVVGDVMAAHPDARFADLRVASRWGLLIDRGGDRMATFVWGLFQQIVPFDVAGS